ncbi:MAG: 1-acyl-sn-glycerol-3-phosphate acyltransferase [Dehalococcoidia bacterium]|nr:MAG: 1-acyl-sn-glycerol-3-phosphate acyltransferase [Dehalococcoidia bacterium]
MGLFYHAATTTMKVLLFAFTRCRIEGKENVPRSGPLIVVSNHLNNIDPPLLGASIPRTIKFMAKQELFEPYWVRAIVQGYGAFPVRRGKLDRKSLHKALEQLRDGRVVGMFPEGSRSFSKQLQPPQPGTALLAARSGAPILPVGISGSDQMRGFRSIFNRPRIKVTIGRPFVLSSAEGSRTRLRLAQHSDLIMEHIARLLPESYRGEYGLRSENGSGNGD